MERQARTAFLDGGGSGGRSVFCSTERPERADTLALDTLALRTLRGFQGVETLGGRLHFPLRMGSEIAPPKDPFRRWISVDLAILAMLVLHDVAAPFTGLDNGATGTAIEATACLFHKDTVCTWFNRDTFHRLCRPFLWISDTNAASPRQHALSPGAGFSLTILR